MKNIKISNKPNNTFITEMEDLSTALKRAYISEGVAPTTAENYTTQQVVDAIKSNTPINEMKTVLRAGSFKTVKEVLTKYSQVAAEKQLDVNVSHYRGYRRKNHYGYYNNNRGNQNNQGRNRNRGAWKNYNSSGRRYYTNQNGRGRGTYRNNGSNQSSNKHVNYTQGNLDGPQETYLEEGKI